MKRLLFALLFPLALFAQSGGMINATRGFPQPQDTFTGVTQYGTAIINSAGNAIAATTANSTVKTYIVLSATSAAAGNAVLAQQGSLAPCIMDSTIASAAGNFYVVNSITNNGQCHAQGTVPSFGVWVLGYLHDPATLANTTAFVEINGFFSGQGGSGTAHAFVVAEGGSPFNYPTPPSTIGDFYCYYHLTSAVPSDPVCLQSGLLPRAIIGATSSDILTAQDSGGIVEHDLFASSANTESLPTPATLSNPAYAVSYSNHSTFSDLVVPVAPYTINSGPNVPVSPGVACRFTVDPSQSANWLSDCPPSAGGSATVPYVTLTDAPTINWSVTGASSNAEVTLGANRNLSITGATNGWHGSLFVNQGTGSHTLGLSAGNLVGGGGAGVVTLSSTAGFIDKLDVSYDGTNFYWNPPLLNYSAAGGGAASFTVIERQSAASTGATCVSGLTITLGTPVSGTTQAIFVAYDSHIPGGAVTITDSGSQGYTKAWELTGVATHDTTGLAYLLGSANGISTVTMQTATSATSCALVVEHVSRTTGTWAVDQLGAASSTGVASPWSSPAKTTTVAHEFLVGGMLAYFSSGGGCAMAATGSWTGTFQGASGGNQTGLLDQSVTSLQTGIQATGTTGTCITFGGAGNYPGILTAK